MHRLRRHRLSKPSVSADIRTLKRKRSHSSCLQLLAGENRKPHPILHVPICNDCWDVYHSGTFETGASACHNFVQTNMAMSLPDLTSAGFAVKSDRRKWQ